MKTMGKRFWITCIAAAVFLMSAAAVYAYFTDFEAARGGAVIRLRGETQLHEEIEEDNKVLVIENTGDTDVIVRVGIYGDFIKEVQLPDEWIKDGDFYYYDGILKPGEVTPAVKVIIDKDAASEAGHDFDVVVVHESERVSYDGTTENRVIKPEGWTLPDIAVGSETEDETEEGND